MASTDIDQEVIDDVNKLVNDIEDALFKTILAASSFALSGAGVELRVQSKEAWAKVINKIIEFARGTT